MLLGEEARRALAQGDVYKALGLLEERQERLAAAKAAAANATATAEGTPTTAATGSVTTPLPPSQQTLPPQQPQSDIDKNGAAAAGSAGAASTTTTTTDAAGTSEQPPLPSHRSPVSLGYEETAGAKTEADTPRAAHARLIKILWRAGHEQEAVETFDMARTRARDAAQAPPPASTVGAPSPARRSPHGKAGAGIPGLFLDLDPETCHGVMRRKMDQQDWLGVIEAMRACSRAPRRKGPAAAGARAAVSGWSPTEETYALGLEACARVRACFFLFLRRGGVGWCVCLLGSDGGAETVTE